MKEIEKGVFLNDSDDVIECKVCIGDSVLYTVTFEPRQIISFHVAGGGGIINKNQKERENEYYTMD